MVLCKTVSYIVTYGMLSHKLQTKIPLFCGLGSHLRAVSSVYIGQKCCIMVEKWNSALCCLVTFVVSLGINTVGALLHISLAFGYPCVKSLRMSIHSYFIVKPCNDHCSLNSLKGMEFGLIGQASYAQ